MGYAIEWLGRYSKLALPERILRLQRRKEFWMSDHGSKSYRDKHGPGATPDSAIEQAIVERSKDGELPCALAFEIARVLGVPPREVGVTLDLLNTRLVKCQLGLFGYKPKKKIASPLTDVSSDLKSRIIEAESGKKLSCRKVWEIAESSGLRKMTVSNACEALGIKIKPCQLGAF